mmetsp:Transcript_4006/g.8506  ORF Transcript_4006/g.8506 Transcript_4006/m.8506 type:complete len:172 (-) Transcript_4006:368-883(-)
MRAWLPLALGAADELPEWLKTEGTVGDQLPEKEPVEDEATCQARCSAGKVQHSLQFECDDQANTVKFLKPASRLGLSKACGADGRCGGELIYGEKSDAEDATVFCKERCLTQVSGCTGFAYRRFENGYEMCAFYADPMRKATRLGTPSWEWGRSSGGAGSRVCELRVELTV